MKIAASAAIEDPEWFNRRYATSRSGHDQSGAVKAIIAFVGS